MSHSQGFDDRCAALVARQCAALEVLACRGCSQLTDGGLARMISGCSGSLLAASLGLSAAVSRGACEQLQGCRGLQVLDLSDSEQLDDRCIELLCGQKGHPFLRYLGLARCSKISSGGVQYLSGTRRTFGFEVNPKPKYPRLVQVDCSGCDRITDDLSS